jgi:enoyl-CoA hydratase
MINEPDLVLVDTTPDSTAVVTLNRPEARNALSPALLETLCDRLEALDADPAIRAVVLTGGPSIFAAGADIKVLAQATPVDILHMNTLSYWQRLRRLNLPLIAAVCGYAYGGGCELALLCDLIVAAEDAQFAQPEIKLGIMPGAGGTQRLSRALGPYRAMELVLTGEPLSAREAFAHGLVNRLAPAERCLPEALALAALIASRPPLAVRLAREAVRYGLDHTLTEGLEIERRNYTLLYATTEQKERMAAFLEKRR